ncbi:MAG: hypothetical protein HC828_03590 [Blastochloris sp.]|nr:hypothetical protein [Blastochloris sp.]
MTTEAILTVMEDLADNVGLTLYDWEEAELKRLQYLPATRRRERWLKI